MHELVQPKVSLIDYLVRHDGKKEGSCLPQLFFADVQVLGWELC